MSSSSGFFAHVALWLSMVYDIGYVPLWNFIKSFACGWIATSLLRFRIEPDMRVKFKETFAATCLLALCVMELSRVLTGVSVGVSPFISLILLWLAFRLHQSKGNVSTLRLA